MLSFIKNNNEIMKATPSLIGAEYIIPSKPNLYPSNSSNGIKKITCRVSERIIPFTGFPMEEKKPEEII